MLGVPTLPSEGDGAFGGGGVVLLVPARAFLSGWAHSLA